MLTPLELTAGQSLLQNTGLAVNADLTSAVSDFGNLDLISTFHNTITTGNAVLLSSVMTTLKSLSANTCPALSDSIPSAYTNLSTVIATPGLTGVVTIKAAEYLGNGDLTKFVQAFGLLDAHARQVNLFLLSAINAYTYLANTFTNMDNLITGDLTSINLATQAFGSDLAKLGRLINFSNLENFGSPIALLQQLSQSGKFTPALTAALLNQGVPSNIISSPRSGGMEGSLGRLGGQSAAATNTIQKAMYRAMQTILGDDLAEILKILGITLPANPRPSIFARVNNYTDGLNSMADLLNPVKIFPNSYQSLTVVTSVGTRPIYTVANTLGTVNDSLKTLLPKYIITAYDRLSTIIPPDLALANKALQVGFQQINTITSVTVDSLSEAFLAIETTKNLPDVIALTQPILTSTYQYYINTLAAGRGTGPNGTITTIDVIGTPSGIPHTAEITNLTTQLQQLETAGNLTTLTSIYTDMIETIEGDFGDVSVGPIVIPSGPAAGTYYAVAGAAITEAMNGGATYTSIVQTSTTGSGNNASITVIRATGTGLYSITLASGGSSHSPGDVVTWAGDNFGGTSPANDITIRVDSVNSPAAAIVDFTILGGTGIVDTPPTGPGLIPAALTEIAAIISANAAAVASMNTSSDTIAAALERVRYNQSLSNLVWADLQANDQLSMLGFVQSLMSIGSDTTEGGAAQLLEGIADLTILGGQAVLAALREGRNLFHLGGTGVRTATQVSGESAEPPPQAVLLGSGYSEAEASAQIHS